MSRFLVILVCLLCGGVHADVTIRGQGSMSGAGSAADRYAIYLKDDQMRIDELPGAEGDEVRSSTLIRFEGSPPGTLYLDHAARKVTVVPLGSVQQVGQMLHAETSGEPVVARNETREIMGETTEGYDFAFTGTFAPAGMAGQDMPPGMADMLKFRMNVSGTAWVAPGMDGAGELAAFYDRMVENGVTFGGIGAQAPAADGGDAGAPSESGGITGVMAEIARKGMPLKTEMTTDVTVEAEGPMAGMLKQMMSGAAGKSTHDTEVTSVSTDEVDAALFYGGGLPEGYEQDTLE